MNLLTIILGGILGFLLVIAYELIKSIISKKKNTNEKQEEVKEIRILDYLKVGYRLLHIRNEEESPFDVIMEKCVFYEIKEIKEGWIKMVSEDNSGDVVRGKINELINTNVFEVYDKDTKIMSCHLGEIQLYN